MGIIRFFNENQVKYGWGRIVQGNDMAAFQGSFISGYLVNGSFQSSSTGSSLDYRPIAMIVF